MGEEQAYIKSGETVGKIHLKTKIYSIYSKIYLPTTHKLKYVIKYAAYSTLKSKSMMVYCHHISFIAFSVIHQLSPHRVNKSSNDGRTSVSTSCLYTAAGFSTFYIGLHFTGTVGWVNILSKYTIMVQR